MEFTFGIITNGGEYIRRVVESIINLNIEKYEIIIVGKLDTDLCKEFNIKFIRYEEDLVDFSISSKKNIITAESKFENIVYLHDYVSFSTDWYSGFLKFGNDFDVCMTRVINNDGSRYRDWCLWEDDCKNLVAKGNYLIPYRMVNLSSMMYISGAYWVAKKKFMQEIPLNENLKWRQGEDVEWSLRARNKTDFKINTGSSVVLLKQKYRIFNETSENENIILSSIKKYDNSNSYDELIKNHIGKWL
jgi:hypothetical protein